MHSVLHIYEQNNYDAPAPIFSIMGKVLRIFIIREAVPKVWTSRCLQTVGYAFLCFLICCFTKKWLPLDLPFCTFLATILLRSLFYMISILIAICWMTSPICFSKKKKKKRKRCMCMRETYFIIFSFFFFFFIFSHIGGELEISNFLLKSLFRIYQGLFFAFFTFMLFSALHYSAIVFRKKRGGQNHLKV